MALRLRQAFLSPLLLPTIRFSTMPRSLATTPLPKMPPSAPKSTSNHVVPIASVNSGNGTSSHTYYRGEILCNRALNMSKIRAVGFDMDYTLAEYNSEAFETLSAKGALNKLVENLGYPREILSLEYDHSFFIRGLVVDKDNGNIIKLDRHKYVKRALHGFKPLSKDERTSMYDTITTSGGGFSEPRFAVLDAMFALPDAFLFSSIVEYKDNHPGAIPQDYNQIYRDVRRSVDMCHRDGTIKDLVAKRPQDFIKRDEGMAPMLRQLKRSGRKVFLLTNSLWSYTNTVMSYLYGQNEEGSWMDLFDVIITGSCKPAFLVDGKLQLYRVHPETGLLENSDGVEEGQKAEDFLKAGKCFQGGNYRHLHDMVGVSNGTHLLYVGDHMFSDVLRSKRTLGWRTMLIVPELENEINTLFDEQTRDLGEQIEILHEQRDEMDERVDRLEGMLVSDDHQSKVRREQAEMELKEARVELEALRSEIVVHVERYHGLFHKTWGQLFKTGMQNSRFAEQVEDYACLYTAKVTNFGKVSPEVYWRAMKDIMPHDRLPVAPMHRVLRKRESVEKQSVGA